MDIFNPSFYNFTPFMLPLLVASAITLFLAYIGFKRRSSPEAPPFVAMMIAVSIWSLFYMLELFGATIETKILWAKLQYLPISITPVFWFIIALGYTGRRRIASHYLFKLIFILPTITFLLALTNSPGGGAPGHDLIWTTILFSPEQVFPSLELTHGSWFWIHVLYSYPMMLYGTILLLYFVFRSKELFAGQGITIMLGAMAPWLGNAIYLSGFSSNVDFTPFAFTITGIALGWGFFRHHFMVVVPVARDFVIEEMPDCLLVFDQDNRLIDINSAARELLTVSARERVIGKSARDLLSGFPELLDACEDPSVRKCEVALEINSRERYFLLGKSPITPEKSKRLPGAVLLLHEITDRKLAELKRAESESMFRALFENATDGIYIKDTTLKYTRVNRAMSRVLGLSMDNILGVTDADLPGLDAGEKNMEEDRAVLEGQVRQVETRRILGGEERTFHTVKVPIKGDKGGIIGLCGIARDITERKMLEQEKERTLAQINSIMNTVPAGLVLLDDSRRILALNAAGGKYMSLLSSAGTGDRLDRLGNVNLAEIIDTSSETGNRSEVRISGPLERIFEIDVYGMDEESSMGSLVLVLQDVTEERYIRSRMDSQDRLAAIGQLAGGIAHDFNNLLTVILGYTDILLAQLAPRDAIWRDIETIAQAGEKASTLTGQLLAFSRRQMLKPRIVNLNRIISEMDPMLQRILGEDVELASKLDPLIDSVRADPTHIEQVILNLVVNARDAMPEGGKIVIESSTLLVDESYAAKEPDLEPGRYVVLAIVDTGHGMDDETMDHIFEPFFTTKKEKGTGLGLSTVYGIIRQSEGHIAVFSKPDGGTTFRILLPGVQEEEEKSAEEPQQRREEFSGSESVLVAEDELEVKKLAVKSLKALGYSVYSAENGEKALELIEARKGDLDLLVTDVIMPVLGGHELVSRVREAFPEIKILFISGYTDSPVIHNEIISSGLDFLQKPFTPLELARTIRKILDSDTGKTKKTD